MTRLATYAYGVRSHRKGLNGYLIYAPAFAGEGLRWCLKIQKRSQLRYNCKERHTNDAANKFADV